MLTAYYTSYIKTNVPQTTNTTRRQLLQYFSANDTYIAITISVLNSTQTDPQLNIKIANKFGNLSKEYTITQNEPKVVIDLTADLAAAKPGEEIVSAKFTQSLYGENSEIFYKDCVNILSNIFISYTYDE
jgi:hypothetical protein